MPGRLLVQRRALRWPRGPARAGGAWPHLAARRMAEVGQQQAGAGLADGLARGIALVKPPCRTHALTWGPREPHDEGDDLVELDPALGQRSIGRDDRRDAPFP